MGTAQLMTARVATLVSNQLDVIKIRSLLTRFSREWVDDAVRSCFV